MLNMAMTEILEKMTGKDKDYRYTATSDLLNELNKENFRVDSESVIDYIDKISTARKLSFISAAGEIFSAKATSEDGADAMDTNSPGDEINKLEEQASNLRKVTESTDFKELLKKGTWLSTSKLVVKPDMLYGKLEKSGLVTSNLDFVEVSLS